MPTEQLKFDPGLTKLVRVRGFFVFPPNDGKKPVSKSDDDFFVNWSFLNWTPNQFHPIGFHPVYNYVLDSTVGGVLMTASAISPFGATGGRLTLPTEQLSIGQNKLVFRLETLLFKNQGGLPQLVHDVLYEFTLPFAAVA